MKSSDQLHFICGLLEDGTDLSSANSMHCDMSLIELLEEHKLILLPDKESMDFLLEKNKDLLDLYHRKAKIHEMRNFDMVVSLLKIVSLFNLQGIKAIPVKGPSLSKFLYGDSLKRVCADLDIFISEYDVSKAVSILEENGFLTEMQLSDGQMKNFIKHEYDFKLYHKKRHLIVELHWELTGRQSRYPITFGMVEGNTESIEIMGKNLPFLPYDIAFIYLCIHNSKHCYENLENIFSIASFFSKFDMNQQKDIIRLACDMKCMNIVLFSIMLAEKYFKIKLDDSIKHEIEKRAFFRDIFKQTEFFLNGKASALHETRFSDMHYHLQDSLLGKIIYKTRLYCIPTCREWSLFPYFRNFPYLFYIIRPFRLFCMWLKLKWRKINEI